MAAKPPKPPGNFLKSLQNQHNNNKNQSQLQQQNNNEYDDIEDNNRKLLTAATTTISSTTTTINPIDCNTTTSIEATKKSNCNCSNISIMHLFHEMKQEFPTIPDTIVAQCVNENCHQRENCIHMLRNELELNPIPAQSYPAKVLHPPNNNNQQNFSNNNNITTTTTTSITTTNSVQKPPLQQKPVNVQQKPPLKPLKPIRTAPLQPPNIQQCNNNNNCEKNSTKTNTIISKNTTTNKQLGGEDVANNDGGIVGNHVGGLNGGSIGGGGGVDLPPKITPQYKQSISTTSNVNSTTAEVNNNDNVCNSVGDGNENVERNIPRQRPTTLNLNTQLQKQQQQQRQRLNVQLQQRFQEQRNRQQQQQLQQQTQNHTTITKPIRKAPLPPIAPKPSQFQTNLTNTNKAFNSFLNDSHSSNNSTTSPLSESEISVSVSLSTPSPTSPNNPTHHYQHQQPFNQHQTHLQTKSPIRHRSVITLQPEPPYTRDFLFTPASLTPTPTSPSLAAPPTATSTTIQTTSSSSATSSPTASIAGSQKSFTSVNLTLRPPVSPTGANSALQPSTIDITAGPGFSGASGGGKSLHYSSTSYDARLGYQQNFQITVTDEGGVFSACRIRPQQQQQRQRCLNQVNISKENQYDGNSGTEIITNQNNYINSFLNAEKQQQQQQQLQQQQQFHNNNVVALQQNIQNSIQSPNGIGGVNTSSGFGSSGVFSGGGGNTSTKISGNMCLPPHQQQAMDDNTQEILQRQKKKRDKLAAALREYKKRLGNVEQEINLLTGTIPTEGLSERLDEEITKLRRDCQDMVRSSSTFSQPPLQQELAINYQPNQQQQQPQPFPRQRITRPPPRPPPPRQTSLDIIQHHSQSSTPHTPPAASLPNLNNIYNSPQLQQHHSSNSLTSPSYYHQQSAPLLPNSNNSNSNHDMYTDSAYNDDEPLVDDVDEYEDEYEEVIEPWECNMCTFRNHPQLNICETCENVRILPGRLSNLPRALSATNCTNLTAATARLAPASIASGSAVSPTQGLLRGPSSGSSNALNNSNSSSRNGLNNNTSNGNLEHDTNFAQQQLQNFALHT